MFPEGVYCYVVVGFDAHDGSVEPVEVTSVRAYSIAMDFFNDDIETLALVAIYAVPVNDRLTGDERLSLIAAKGHLPAEWRDPLATRLFGEWLIGD